MKKSLFVMMIAAALMGGQVFATDPIPTSVEGYASSSGSSYYGAYKDDGSDASGGNVSVSASATGSDLSQAFVYGGRSTQGGTSNNKITMTGGQVSILTGGYGKTSASGNTAIMTGGSVIQMHGGESTKDASGNIAIVAGDSVVSSVLGGGFIAFGGDAANDNKIYLVGKGATATIADAQGKTATYTGGAISVGAVVGGRGTVSAGNSIDIYGTGITVSNNVQNMQILTFHIADGLLPSQEAMISMTSKYVGLDLTGVELGFYNDDVQDWSVFDGKTITLVSTVKSITVGEGSLGDVAIKGADGATVATATLGLENENKSLVLSNIKGTAPVPEPTTGTLSLLALAGLCIRRRRK